MRELILTALKGFAMGAANVIPGVSGGTIAFITGIYERLIQSLKSFDLETVKLVFAGKIPEAIKRVDLLFLGALGVGAVLSIVTLAKVLKWGFESHPTLVWAFFFGLIAASIPLVGKMVKSWKPAVVVLAVLGCLAAVSLVFVKPAQESDNVFYLGLCGVVAMCSMIIPGLSGSFVLVLMGNYKLVMLDSVSNLTDGKFGEALPILIPVGVGALVGLVVLSRLLNWLFKNYHDEAVGLITGFVIGSLAIIWPWKDEVLARNEAGLILVKTEERALEARTGTLSQVTQALGDEEELVVEGYGNWQLPNFGDGADWLAILFAVAGGFLIAGIEFASRRTPQSHGS